MPWLDWDSNESRPPRGKSQRSPPFRPVKGAMEAELTREVFGDDRIPLVGY